MCVQLIELEPACRARRQLAALGRLRQPWCTHGHSRAFTSLAAFELSHAPTHPRCCRCMPQVCCAPASAVGAGSHGPHGGEGPPARSPARVLTARGGVLVRAWRPSHAFVFPAVCRLCNHPILCDGLGLRGGPWMGDRGGGVMAGAGQVPSQVFMGTVSCLQTLPTPRLAVGRGECTQGSQPVSRVGNARDRGFAAWAPVRRLVGKSKACERGHGQGNARA